MPESAAFRRQLLFRLLRAANAGSLGFVAAAGCGARSPLDVSPAAAGDAAKESQEGGQPNVVPIAVPTAVPIADTSSDQIADTGSIPIATFDAATSYATDAAGAAAEAAVLTDGAVCEARDAALREGGDVASIHRLCIDNARLGGPPCPMPGQLLNDYFYLSSVLCGQPSITAVFCGPEASGSSCCYVVEQNGPPYGCYVGRAFLVDEGLLKAELGRGTDWRVGPAPETHMLSDPTRRALVKGWVLDGLFEHASVASFARLALQLLAVGAPADLVRDAYAAGLDEIRHAELCFALASAYAGADLAPQALPVPPDMRIERDLPTLVAESVIEGCIGETLAAAQAAEALARATDPAVVEALASTLDDEIRHAELAWRFVAWAIDKGGPETRAAAARTFANFVPPAPPADALDGVSLEAFASHGRLTGAEARATALRAIREVVQPCCCALLSFRAPHDRKPNGEAVVLRG